MFPEPTELRLIGYSIESIWTQKNPNQVHQHQKPTCRHSNQRKISHVTNGIICCVCSILTISVLQLVSESMEKKSTTRFRRRASHSEVEANDESYCKGILGSVTFRRQKARGRKAMEIRVLGERKLRKKIDRGDPL